jgi:hypothetical protein
VSAHPWWMGSGGVHTIGQGEISALAESLARVLAAGQFGRITLASTTQGLGGKRWALEDDALAAAAVRDAMPPTLARRVRLVRGYLSAHQYAELAARHSAVLSMRMHGALLAATVGTPTLLANGSDKARGLADGIPVVATPAELAHIDERLGRLHENRVEWKLGQARALAAMKQDATRNAEYVAALLANG